MPDRADEKVLSALFGIFDIWVALQNLQISAAIKNIFHSILYSAIYVLRLDITNKPNEFVKLTVLKYDQLTSTAKSK